MNELTNMYYDKWHDKTASKMHIKWHIRQPNAKEIKSMHLDCKHDKTEYIVCLTCYLRWNVIYDIYGSKYEYSRYTIDPKRLSLTWKQANIFQ